jgi:hypothetical protein
MVEPLKGGPVPSDEWMRNRLRKGAQLMDRLRRILLSLGAVAAFLMAAGAGWRNY